MTGREWLQNIPNWDSISCEIDRLQNIKSSLSPDLAFLIATINNPEMRKIENSYSGHTMRAIIKAVSHSATMGISRFWDADNPIKLARSIKAQCSEIIDCRKRKLPFWPDENLQVNHLKECVSETEEMCDKLIRSNEFNLVRVFRTEQIAHYIPGRDSKDRKKFGLLGDEGDPQFDDVISLAHESLKIFDRLKSHWDFHVENSLEKLSIEKKYAHMFWKALPEFSKIEDDSGFSTND